MPTVATLPSTARGAAAKTTFLNMKTLSQRNRNYRDYSETQAITGFPAASAVTARLDCGPRGLTTMAGRRVIHRLSAPGHGGSFLLLERVHCVPLLKTP